MGRKTGVSLLWLTVGMSAGLVLGVVLLWGLSPRQECRVLTAPIRLEGPHDSMASGGYLPVSTRVVVERSGEYASELRVPVRLPVGASTRSCDAHGEGTW